MVGTTHEETPKGRALLYATKSVDREATGEGDQDVSAQADGSQAWAEQPEAFAEPFAFGGGNATRGPNRPQQILQDEKEERCCYIDPIGKDGGRDQGPQATKRIEDDALEQ